MMSGVNLSGLLRPELADLRAYAPEERDGIVAKLDANEAPPIASRELSELVAAAVAKVPLERYPDARALALKEAIASRSGVKVEELFIGSGSDEVISLLATGLARPRNRNPAAVVLSPSPSFVMYRVTGRAHGWKSVEVPLVASWDLDPRTMTLAVETMQPNVVYIATPNNPTGNAMTEEKVEACVKAAAAGNALVVIDEAYADYAGKSLRHLRAAHDNVAVMRTVSKLGLAALRVGWLEGSAALVAELDKVRQPFNVSATSQAAVAAVLTDGYALLEKVVRGVVDERTRLTDALSKMPGVVVTPSAANFLWMKTEALAEEVHEKLAEHGVLVRSFHAGGGRLKHQLRVTIGMPHENDMFLEALTKALS
jgi:histidinol-phosphate aminotransferase